MATVFLSAGIPMPDDPFERGVDKVGIRESVNALAECMTGHTVVFGGHPTITPLLALPVSQEPESSGGHLVVYETPADRHRPDPASAGHVEIKTVASVDGESRDDTVRKTVVDDYVAFSEAYPDAPRFPVASTGAAALHLWTAYHQDRRDLLDDLHYRRLFRNTMDEVATSRSGPKSA